MPHDDHLTTELTELTSTLIGFETVVGNERGMDACLHCVGEYLSEADGIHLAEYRHNGVASLVASFHDTKEPELLLLGHLDVVPGSPEQFQAVRRGDALHGRGAIDMKGQDAVMLYLMRQLALLPQRPNVALALTFDEEVGGVAGAGHLVNDLEYRPKLVIAPDGGDPAKWAIIHAEKGAYEVHLRAHGKAAHSAYPWEGTNALDELLEAYAKLRVVFPPLDHTREYWHPTLNLSSIHGGVASNMVPGEAEMVLNTRLTEVAQIAWVRGLIKEHFGRFEITRELVFEPTRTDPSHPAILRLASLIQQATGQPPGIRATHGSSDGKYFAPFGIPTIMLKPIGGDVHGRSEWVSVTSLRQLYEVLYQFIARN